MLLNVVPKPTLTSLIDQRAVMHSNNAQYPCHLCKAKHVSKGAAPHTYGLTAEP